MFASKVQTRGFELIAGLFILASGFVTAGEVTVYDKAPSVEELQNQLTGGDGSAVVGKSRPRTRAIVFGDSAQQDVVPAPTQQQPEYQPQQPASRSKQQAHPQQQATKPRPQPQTMQVGENAIAFPINFLANSSDILPEAIPFLDSIAGLMKKDQSVRLMVEGHTDISGSPARNSCLSRERAYSVVNYLIVHYRIEPTRLMPVGKGFSEPLQGMDASNPKNRRVQFRIIG